jgi:hypothetical protein
MAAAFGNDAVHENPQFALACLVIGTVPVLFGTGFGRRTGCSFRVRFW